MERTSEKGKAPVWRKMDRPYLYRYLPKGTYYLRGRFGGAPVRVCLKTTEYMDAVAELEVQRAKLLADRDASSSGRHETIWDAVRELDAFLAASPSLRAASKVTYCDSIKRMRPGMRHALPAGPAHLVPPLAIVNWWNKVAAEYAPMQANMMLWLVKRALKRMRKKRPTMCDPTAELKRVRVPRTRLELLTKAEFSAVVETIRSSRTTNGHNAANYIEFAAYSGCRPKEVRHIEWRDIGETAIQVWGGPERTKNGEMRLVPIVAPMRALLERMRGGMDRAGTLFSVIQPRHALKRACEKLSIKHQRIYDLRHLFATTCLESGVDVPTFAHWMGHKDGGALALKTYVQNRSEHRDRMAAKVTFL